MKDINLYQLLASLSLSIDLAESSINLEAQIIESVTDIDYSKHKFQNHAARTCYVAMQIGSFISKDPIFLQTLFLASSLHDIGAAASKHDFHNDNHFIMLHCLDGCKLASMLPLEYPIADIIKFHHENYNGTGNFGLKSDDIPLISQIIRISDIFELLYDENVPNHLQRDRILEWLSRQSKIVFSPYLIDILKTVQMKDAFWWDVENVVTNWNFKKYYGTMNTKIGIQGIRSIAELFAELIDSKSPFTFTHSTNLSKLIAKTSQFLGFSNEKKELLYISALLHDLGKLYIPNKILDKPGMLTKEELTIMRSHTYFTKTILSKIDGFEDITAWGANHHEKLNGSGYPYNLTDEDLCEESKLMAVCDIYEALTADRPYRKGLTKAKALEIIDNMVEKNELSMHSTNTLKNII